MKKKKKIPNERRYPPTVIPIVPQVSKLYLKCQMLVRY